MAAFSIYYYNKYKKNTKLQLEDFGSSKHYLDKCYYSTFPLSLLGISAFYATSGGALDSNVCSGGYRCIEAHNVTWWIFGLMMSCSSLVINRLSKSMLEIFKERNSNK